MQFKKIRNRLRNILENKKGNIEARGKEIFVGVILLLIIVSVMFTSGGTLFPNWSSIENMPPVLVVALPLIVLLIVFLWFLGMTKMSKK